MNNLSCLIKLLGPPLFDNYYSGSIALFSTFTTQAHIPLFLYPFLHTISKTRPFEYLRLTSLGVIGALVKTDEQEVMEHFIDGHWKYVRRVIDKMPSVYDDTRFLTKDARILPVDAQSAPKDARILLQDMMPFMPKDAIFMPKNSLNRPFDAPFLPKDMLSKPNDMHTQLISRNRNY